MSKSVSLVSNNEDKPELNLEDTIGFKPCKTNNYFCTIFHEKPNLAKGL